MSVPRQLAALWAKRGPSSETARGYHPVPCHLIDVAAVALALWKSVLPAAARREIAEALGLDEVAAGRWIAFWAGLHDLGKASPAFQAQDPTARERLAAVGLHLPRSCPSTPHGTIGAAVIPQLLTTFGLEGSVALRVGELLGGHHGIVPSSRAVNEVPPSALGGPAWDMARRALVDAVAEVLELPRGQVPTALPTAVAAALAGFVTVSDWIGSDEQRFPYAVPDTDAGRDLDLVRYGQAAERRAADAIRSLGWLPVAARDRRTFADLFPRVPEPNPLQRAVLDLAPALAGPCLVVIEAPMGEGKTEAALALVDRLLDAHGRRGCYVALPTRATSNQLFTRVQAFLAHRHVGGPVNLQLLHGEAVLAAELGALMREPGEVLQPQKVYDEVHDKELDADRAADRAAVVAAEWFTYRKRGLLAPFGVGTVDQALLAVLRTRHVFVRLFGLGQKVVVIDEVHAYDTYMTELLDRLLEWLAALGSSVVLLSATLPAARRRALAAAYARGLALSEAPNPPEAAYPRLTWLSAGGAGARTVAASPTTRKRVTIQWVDGTLPAERGAPFPLGEALQKALAQGGCAAVICNTVARAQAVYRALQPYFPDRADDGAPELDLLHARFPAAERADRERRAQVRFGPPGGTVRRPDGGEEPVRRPWRAVLVSTQIIEQSLDLDFDLLVSDPAPADLVLQRAGRLHRHRRERPAGLRDAALWLVTPVVADGVPTFDGGTAAVYDEHVLLRSWLALKDRAAVLVPDDVEALVEETYGERPCPEGLGPALRARWQETLNTYTATMERDRQEARDRWLRRPGFDGPLWRLTDDAMAEDAPDFHPAHQALTRLADPTVPVICLYRGPAGLTLDSEGREPVDPSVAPDLTVAKRLLARSVPVSSRRLTPKLLGQPVPPGWQQSPLLRHHRLLTLDHDGTAVVGDVRVRLDRDVGLEILGP